jgi:transposase InsO family protein
VVDFIKKWSEKAELEIVLMLGWVGLCSSKYYGWSKRYGKANEHNKSVPRDHWLADWEKQKIVKYYCENPLEGYRRLTYMMLDSGVVAVSPSSTYRVLKQAGLLEKWKRTASKKGSGFEQPLKAHQHWHTDITYLNMGGTFYYMCSVLDGYSRMIVHWEIGPQMKESDVEMVIQKGLEKYPGVKPRIISDNGPQFVAKDFKEYIRLTGMTHVKTSPYYPQSNGKLEGYHKSYKVEGWRPGLVETLEEAKELTAKYVEHYNEKRLHSGIGYIAPKDKLDGREEEIWKQRDEQLENARKNRADKRRSGYVKEIVNSLVEEWSVSNSN